MLIWAKAVVRCFSTVARRQLMYPRPPINVVTVFGLSSFGLAGVLLCDVCVAGVALLCDDEETDDEAADEATDVIDGGPEFVAGVTLIVAAGEFD